MRKYEIESLIKSFFIFFSMQVILLGVIVLQNYKQEKLGIFDQIQTQMKICSYDLACDGLELDFVENSLDKNIGKLYTDEDIYSYFKVPTQDDYLMKVILPQKSYLSHIERLKDKLVSEYIWYFLLVGFLSFIFSLYALYPLKKALNLNEEFVKDILHDINTPLSSMVVNFKLFKKEIGENRKIERMQHSVSTILSLQDNLQSFLDNSKLQKEIVELGDVLLDRVEFFKGLYPQAKFEFGVGDLKVKTNQDAIKRLLDNLIGNACKYSTKNAIIQIYMKDSTLYIQDNGQGIKDVKKVFKRYYKENERGLGIGMHIVKKLCDSLTIDISIKSKLEQGTTIMLDLREVIVK